MLNRIMNLSRFIISSRLTRLSFIRTFRLSKTRGTYFVIQDNNDFVEKVMNSNIPVIVNFHADWCEPCHILTPKLKELLENSEDIALAMIDVEKHVDLVHTFEVKAVPAVLAVRNGLVIDKFIGLVDGGIIDNLIIKLSKDQNSR